MFKKIKRFFGRVFKVITPAQATLSAIALPVFIFVLVFVFLFDFVEISDNPSWWLIFLFLLFFFILAVLVSMLLVLAVRIIQRIPKNYLRALFFAYVVVFLFGELSKWYGWIFFTGVFILPSIIVAAIYKWRKGELFPLKGAGRIFTFIISIIASISFIVFLYLVFDPGQDAEPQKNVRMLGKLPDTLTAPDPSAYGKYEVGFLTYGSGTDKKRDEFGKGIAFRSPVVDASLMLKSWKGLSGKLRTAFFGFDNEALPLNARVWYPKNQDTIAPLILIVHGNHMAQDYSDSGYAYLGRMFASRGYVVASVDENFVNSSITDLDFTGGGLKGENGVRGWLLLKHLEAWRNFNKDISNPFFGKIDIDRIALIGHSRGGEAVGHAAMLNRLKYFPDNAKQQFVFNFNIRAVMAIAPVDGQYQPGGVLVPLKDINYFVLQGAQDMDLISYAGLPAFKRIRYSPGFDGFKAGLYLNLANHGQFNTSWGQKDGSGPYIHKFNLRQLLKPADQEKVARVYIGAFIDATLRGKKEYKPLFMDYRVGRQWLPDIIYLNQFEPSQKTVIADFEDDLDLETASSKGGRVITHGLSMWKEQMYKTEWGGQLSNAAYIGWKRDTTKTDIPSYAISLPDSLAADLNGKMLAFSLTQTDNNTDDEKEMDKKEKKPGTDAGRVKTADSVKTGASPATPGNKPSKDKSTDDNEKAKKDDEKKKDERPIDFSILLTDSAGNRIKFLLSECGFLQPVVNKHLTKFAFLNTSQDSEPIPNLFYFDMDKLKSRYPEFVFSAVKEVALLFDQRPEGAIIFDDLWFADKEHLR